MNDPKHVDRSQRQHVAGHGERQPWESMAVTYLGDVSELVRTGEGKDATVAGGDTGEPTKKPQGSG